MVVGPRDSRLFGTVELFDEAGALIGSREVGAASNACDPLIETLTLALAIAIDAQVLTRPEPAPAPAPEVQQPEPPPPPPPAPPVTSVKPEPAAELPAGLPASWSVTVGPTLTVGLLPEVAFGVSLQGRWKPGDFSLAIEGAAFPASSFEAAGGVVFTSNLRGGLVACGHVGLVAFCGRGTGGVLRASGSGFGTDRRGLLPTATLGPIIYLEGRPLSSIMARAGVGLDVALIRNSLFVGDVEVWNAPPVAAEAVFAIGWSSP
jgi:hypothetical protein